MKVLARPIRFRPMVRRGASRPPNAALEKARAAVDRAARNPQVVRLGDASLAGACAALARANAAWSAGREPFEVAFLAYVTWRHAAMAELRACHLTPENSTARDDQPLARKNVGVRKHVFTRIREQLASNEKSRQTDTATHTLNRPSGGSQ